MGYRTVDAAEPTKELAALKYAVPKETRLVLKKHHIMEGNWQQGCHTKLKYMYYYTITKNAIHERVEFNCEFVFTK